MRLPQKYVNFLLPNIIFAQQNITDARFTNISRLDYILSVNCEDHSSLFLAMTLKFGKPNQNHFHRHALAGIKPIYNTKTKLYNKKDLSNLQVWIIDKKNYNGRLEVQ